MAECLASVVTQFRQPLQLQPIPMPELEPFAMLARVDAATLCGTDVHIWHGFLAGADDRLPYIPGHETAGSIVEMRGPRTDLLGRPLREGDRVIWTYPRCGRCYHCRVVNQPTLCPNSLSFGRVRCDRPPYLLGGLAEYQYVPPDCEVVKVPDNVSAALAASAACALRTVIHGYERLGAIGPHETVLVQGCGPVGLYALAVARDRGARRLLVIGAPAARLEIAREWGAEATLNLDEVADIAARRDWAREQSFGRGPDLVVQCANAAAIPEALDMVRPGGRVLSIGAGGGNVSVTGAALSVKQLQVIGVLSGQDRHYFQALEFLSTRREFPFDRMISGSYPLRRANDALLAMEQLREVKPVIVPHSQ